MLDFLNGMIERDENINRLITLKQEIQPAELTGDNQCIKSGFCCFKRPVVPTPDDIDRLAKHFKITPIEFINKYCAIDTDGASYYPKLSGLNQQDLLGKFIPSNRTFDEGACILLSKQKDDGTYECTVHKIKPLPCVFFKCWGGGSGDPEPPSKRWKPNILLTKYGINGSKLEYENW